MSRSGHHQHLTSLFCLILQFFTFLILFLAVPWQFLVSLILFHRLSRDGHHQHPTKSLLCLILQSFTFPILFSVKLLLFLILPFYLTPSAPDPPPLLDPATLHVYDLYLWSYFTAWSWQKKRKVFHLHLETIDLRYGINEKWYEVWYKFNRKWLNFILVPTF